MPGAILTHRASAAGWAGAAKRESLGWLAESTAHDVERVRPRPSRIRIGYKLSLPMQTPSLFATIACILASALLASAAYGIGKRGGYRFRVMCLAVLFLSLIVAFAGIYGLVAHFSPSAFRVDDTLLDLRVREDVTKDRAAITRDAKIVYAASVLEAESAAVYATLTALPVNRTATIDRQLRGGLIFRYTEVVGVPRPGSNPDAPGSEPMDSVSYRVFDSDGQELITYVAQGYRLFPTVDIVQNPSVQLGNAFRRAENANDVAAAARQFGNSILKRQTATIAHMSAIVNRSAHLELSHYIYFSATIMTTIGSSDIMPAISLSRYMATCQALVAVFFLGFAINFLRPSANAGE